MSNNTLCKVFVGNVPFQCNQNEFRQCFENFEGFVKAEIIYKSNTNISRGFGFVVFDKQEHAQKLINRNDVMFKDRLLRFTKYSMTDKKMELTHTVDKMTKQKNYLLVKNIPTTMTKEELKMIFSKMALIGRHFIVTNDETGLSKGHGIVEIIDDSMYKILVQERSITTHDGNTYELSKWKLVKQQKEQKITKDDLQKAYIAGRNMGILEGLKTKKHNYVNNR
jgi:RNA recognition motif-containing protein